MIMLSGISITLVIDALDERFSGNVTFWVNYIAFTASVGVKRSRFKS